MTSNTELRPADPGAPPVGPEKTGRRRREPPPERARFRLFHLVLYLFLGGLSVAAILAFLWVLNVSFKTDQEFIGTPPWSLADSIRLTSFRDAWVSADVGRYFWNSVVVSVSATALGIVLAVFAAYPIARIPFKFSGLVLGMFVTGLMVPWMVTFIPLSMIIDDLGLSDTHLGLILVYATYNLPFNIFVLVGFMKTLPKELEEAAAVDGAGPTRTFASIIMPLLGPGLSSVAIISFLNNWNEFFYALVLIHSEEKATLPLGLFQLSQAAEYGSQWPKLFAGMIITAVPVLLVYGLLQRRVTAGLTVGAVKG
ncbi:carbohydrate ABC transporter permease [Nakamurella lactea]|uniref:carbohydrate ABC transporter permease n=1 Tax=Nakamurella lactea TaxID=459515 RepID=UPI00040038AE|nr:carbohydrate ABC transporter permease [Nakamurella lactea]